MPQILSPDQTPHIADAVQALRKAAGAGHVPDEFAYALYADADEEDLEVYSSEELAVLIEKTWQEGEVRRYGKPSISISNPPEDAGKALQRVSVVTIHNDNMPFLVDSTMAALQSLGCEIRLVVHPIFTVTRDATTGKRLSFQGLQGGEGIRESLIQIHVERLESDERMQEIRSVLDQTLEDVRISVVDWHTMLDRLKDVIAGFRNNPPPIPVDEIAEAVQFLEWLADNNFTFLGMRSFEYKDGDHVPDPKSGLGLLRKPERTVLQRGGKRVTMTDEIRDFLMQPVPLIITKANIRSQVHRRVHMDYIGVKLFDDEGQLKGELRIVGLFTSTAYTKSVRTIPYLRRKTHSVLQRAGYDPDSHSGKALINVLESYPRDELFQIGTERLYAFVRSIMQLNERPRVRALARRDRFDRFVSVLVFVPRERYNSSVRQRIGDYLANYFNGRVSAFYPTFPEGTLARVHYIIGRDEGRTPDFAQDAVEEAIEDIIKTWPDRLRTALQAAIPFPQSKLLQEKYAGTFDKAYEEAFTASEAVEDIRILERIEEKSPLFIGFREDEALASLIHLKLYHAKTPIPLSDRLPILENMGFHAIDEHTYAVDTARNGEADYWIHDIMLRPIAEVSAKLASVQEKLVDLFMAVWEGAAENDGFNRLTLLLGLGWRKVAMLRAYARYLRQANVPYDLEIISATLIAQRNITADLVALFEERFMPTRRKADAKEDGEAAIKERILANLEAVTSLDEDRILRAFLDLIEATLRTNFYQKGEFDGHKATITFKLRSKAISILPEPKPYAEIFVYSPRVEGVHLRFGPIARGGLRWSDRALDFRTEVLGLVKAQQVKNAVIVPVGAKGGFVPRQLPPASAGREAMFKEGTESYKVFVSSLLDLTDNITPQGVSHPDSTVRHDSDDPYLVVAADKGTATFSDTANAISEAYGFWLGDAFASGGSAGYDHKKMGITARGAWEAVKRHFREMNHDIQSEPFSVIGVGDMSGDVFGNGMLLSPRIRLLAAFDHRDIFFDPDPDMERSFEERKRLFEMGRSSWQDYDTSVISAGGGVFSRSAKSIQITPQIKTLLGTEADKLAPPEIMHLILKMHADLLWFGGIGTYVRASTESNTEVGDKANDALRISARQLNVKVIGEGANLGMTQLARIEFAHGGGKLNTDAIDNSAGVNSSDVEVNIKIAFRSALEQGKLDVPERNVILEDMTEDVGQLVLRNNYLQTLALSLTERKGMEDFSFQVRFMKDLTSRGLLDREVENLPDDMTLQSHAEAGTPLTRPELAVLLAYAKINLFNALLESQVLDDSYWEEELLRYFPPRMQREFRPEIDTHRLRREIIATQLSNSMINRAGPSFVTRITGQTGASVASLAAAYATARDAFALRELNNRLDALDNRIDGELQVELYGQVQDLLLQLVLWFVRHGDYSGGLGEAIAHYAANVEELKGKLEEVVHDGARTWLIQRREELVEAGVPEELAHNIAALPLLAHVPDIVAISDRTSASLTQAAQVFYFIGERFQLNIIDRAAGRLSLTDYYDRLALNQSLDTLARARFDLAARIVEEAGHDREAVAEWVARMGQEAARIEANLMDVTSAEMLTLSQVTVAANLLSALTRLRSQMAAE